MLKSLTQPTTKGPITIREVIIVERGL